MRFPLGGGSAIDKVGFITRPRYAQAGYPIADQLLLRDYHSKWWKFALVPGRQDLKSKTISDVAAWQYYQCNYYVLTDLANIDPQQVFSLSYEDFIRRPVEIIRQIFAWADLPPSQIAEDFGTILPRVNDATPGAQRSRQGLRYPDAVFRAIERLPVIGNLQGMMGYDCGII